MPLKYVWNTARKFYSRDVKNPLMKFISGKTVIPKYFPEIKHFFDLDHNLQPYYFFQISLFLLVLALIFISTTLRLFYAIICHFIPDKPVVKTNKTQDENKHVKKD